MGKISNQSPRPASILKIGEAKNESEPFFMVEKIEVVKIRYNRADGTGEEWCIDLFGEDGKTGVDVFRAKSPEEAEKFIARIQSAQAGTKLDVVWRNDHPSLS